MVQIAVFPEIKSPGFRVRKKQVMIAPLIFGDVDGRGLT
jgi:hypothetical protein